MATSLPTISNIAGTAGVNLASPSVRSACRTKTVLLVVNVLPLIFERNTENTGWTVEWNTSATSMFYRNLLGDSEQYRPLYIGCPEVFIAKEEEITVEKQLRAYNCVPVFLDPAVAHRYFQGFCKGVLWPIFHNIVDVYNSAKFALDDLDEAAKRDRIHPLTEPQHKAGAAHNNQSCKAWYEKASWNPAAQDKCWADYCSVNRTFARRVLESYHEGNLIWIHDFHFLMLPSYLLRKLRLTALIAIYLHVPFPSSEIFRCLAMRTEIIRAMLSADHIGFLIFEHARHFLTSCKRLLGLNYKTGQNGMLVVEYNGRSINISCSHIEPDTSHLYGIMDQNEVNECAVSFKKHLEQHIYDSKQNKKFVFASVDRLEGLTAIPLKLRAFDRFLGLHPDKRNSVILVQIGLSLDSRPNDYHQTRDYVTKFTAEINRRWAPQGEQVVYFEEKPKTTCVERMVLWRLCDVYLDTCVRGGLSLLPFEYIIGQKRNHDMDSSRPFGTMIVSEFASYSRVMNGCMLVNPWKVDDMVNAFVKTTEMSYYEKHNRFHINYKLLASRAETKWTERVLADFEAIATTKQSEEAGETVAVGFGFEYRVMQFQSGFVKLDVDELLKKCVSSSRRLFVFDYGGTLSATTSVVDESGSVYYHSMGTLEGRRRSDIEDQKIVFGQATIRYMDGQVRTPLSSDVRENIQTLCNDPRNIVFVMSTGRRVELDGEFNGIANLNLISDNGFYLKKAGNDQWECIYNEEDLYLDWKEDVKQIMQAYAARTNGAYVIVSEASLLYDYRNSDPEYGEIQSLELYDQLRQLLKPGEATVYRAKGFVQVHQFGVNKSSAIALILGYLKDKVGIPDFAFIAGDDQSDEMAFQALHSLAEAEPHLQHAITCTVGMKPSSAKTYVDSLSDILAAIQAVATRLRFDRTRSKIANQHSYRDHFQAVQGNLVTRHFIRSLLLLEAPPSVAEPPDPAKAVSIASSPPLYALTGLSTATMPSPIPTHSTPVNWLSVGAALIVGCTIGAGIAHRVQNLQRLRSFCSFSVSFFVSERQRQTSTHTKLKEELIDKALGMGWPTRPAREQDPLISGIGYNKFCSISLSSDPRGSKSGIDDLVKIQTFIDKQQKRQTRQQDKLRRPMHPRSGCTYCCWPAWRCCCTSGLKRHNEHNIKRVVVRPFVVVAMLLILVGMSGVAFAISRHLKTDEYLFVGAMVSAAFSLVVILCYIKSLTVRSYPNPLIFSKSLVDLLVAALYIFQYCATEYRFPPMKLPFRIAALTQALLVCGEFWFFAIPIDMVQSITNPFTSYSYNFRIYWFYSTLSGVICGFALWFLDDSANPHSFVGKDDEQRFFWFHHNTDMPGFFWHRWIMYHIWVFAYLIFGVACILYVKRRLRRGIEETFDVRRRVLSNGIMTCAIYISWALIVLLLFIMTNSVVVESWLGAAIFDKLIDANAFLHSARGCVTIIVWLIINAPHLSALYVAGPSSARSQSSSLHFSPNMNGSSISSASRGFEVEKEPLIKPELNKALRKQMIQMATSGIIESVELYHRLYTRVEANQSFNLDWDRSKQKDLQMRRSVPPLGPLVQTRSNSIVKVVEAKDRASQPRMTLLPMAMTEIQFYDFQPRVFASIRQLFGVDDSEYMYAFRYTMNERISEGRSGAFVFNTCDRKYLVKSMTAEEKDVLLELLPSYLRYLKWNPKTLLPRFFGFHAMKMYGQIFHFIVMGNILNTSEVIHRRYDIKGSWVDRNAPACILGEQYRCSKCYRFFKFGDTNGDSCESTGADHYPDIILRDNDLKKRLKLEVNTATQLLKQLTRDSNFLASMGIMDYSLLIGTHYSHFTITNISQSQPRKPTGTEIFHSDHHEFTHMSSHDETETSEEHEEQALCQRNSSRPLRSQSEDTHSHCYPAHQVSGPSVYYFGLVDILQKWTFAKQMERMYKVNVLRKDPRGISAISPKLYANRFQQKMKQLFVTTPQHLRVMSMHIDEPTDEVPDNVV